MKEEMFFTGKTVALALTEAAQTLGVPEGKINYEVIAHERQGFLGIGAQPAKIRVISYTPAIVKEDRPKSDRPRSDRSRQDRGPRDDKGRGERHDRPRTEKPKPEPKVEEIPAEEEISKEPMPVLAGEITAREFLEQLLENMELDARIEVKATRKSDRAFNIKGEDAGVLIGHHGDTLDALQYLTNLAANKREEDESRDYVHITVDIENYRSKREGTLRALARRMAAKVQKYKKSVMLEPMNPYERRIIHSEVQGIEGVSTNSVGSENNRRVVIYLESEGFSVPSKMEKTGESGRRKRDSRRRKSSHSADTAPAVKQPVNNIPESERMSAEEVENLISTYAKDRPQREQPKKYKDFDEYISALTGFTSGESEESSEKTSDESQESAEE